MIKNTLYLLLAALLLASCGEEKSDLEVLKKEHSELKKEYDAIGKELAKLEQKMADMDTTRKLTLVTTLPAMQRDFEHYFEVQGVVESDQNITMFPEMGGTITNITVREGQSVRKGQLLVSMDADVLIQNIKEVQSALELANTVYERQNRLWAQKIGSEMQYLEAKNRKESLETSLKGLEAQLAKMRVRAPFSGVVDEIFPKVGELTAPQTPLLRLINMEKMYINADISETYVGKISEGTKVKVEFPGMNELIDAQIKLVGNYIDPNNRSFRVQVELQGMENQMKPNQLVFLHIKDFDMKDGIVLPNRVIQQGPDGKDFVYLADSNAGETQVRKVFVETGLNYKNETLVLEGVGVDAHIVDKGGRSIQDDQTVRVVQ